MKNGLMLVAVFLMFRAGSASGQTAADIETKYGKPVNAYSVGASIWMTPEYTSDGQVCRMRLYPKRLSGNNNYLVGRLPFEEFNMAVEELAPPSSRGAKAKPFGGGLWTLGGRVMWATFTYEKLTIMYSAGFELDLKSLKESKPLDFPVKDIPAAGKKAESATGPGDDFLPYQESTVEMVTITWNGRTCAGQQTPRPDNVVRPTANQRSPRRHPARARG